VARRANFYKKTRDPNANWLTLDIGNYLSAESNKQCSPKCNLMLRSYQAMKYDVLGLSSMELGLGPEVLTQIRDTLGIPMVCANVVDLKTQKPVVEPYIIRRYGNMIIGITGLLKNDPSARPGIDTTRLKVMPQLDVARDLIPKLHRKVDAIILLCDFGNKEVDTLLKVVPQIDVIMTTGSVQPHDQVIRFGKTLLVPAIGASGQNGTALTLEFNPAWGDSLGYNLVNVELTEEYEGENQVTQLVAASKQSSSAQAEAVKPATAKEIKLEPSLGASPQAPGLVKSKVSTAPPGGK
jgi:2',3'-cyclic-nucleotide 2'-phosphodiesterase (5'-nucleotidase family)